MNNEVVLIIIELLILLAVLLLGFFILCMSALAFVGAPWVPTKTKVAQEMFKIAQVKPGETVVDFGCGDASLLIVAAKQFRAKGIGYDFNPALCHVARIRAWIARVSDRLEINRANFFKIDFPPADVIACYLLPEVQAKLEPLLLKAYPTGTRIVAHDFKYPSLKLEKQTRLSSGETVYLYLVP